MASPKPLIIDYAAVARTTLFKDLPLAALEDICSQAQTRMVKRNGFFFAQGDPIDRQYLLLAGRVKITQLSADGQQTLLRAIGPYHLFGVVILAQMEAYPVSAEAQEDCTALGWTRSTLIDLIHRYPDLALNAFQIMAAHTQEFQERFRQMATERVEHRLAHTLLRLANQAGKKLPEGVLIDLPLTRQDLGEMAGTTQYTVSRLLTQWESQGLIIAGREHIVIRFPHGLVTIAEG
ncbi:MAG TPA: Crp/Fnr family transcriptional regulator [Anaerolineaceae bacterium]|nr:Crp/Fnr family transcriptional regulator [Anaerolineaceae bacterium]